MRLAHCFVVILIVSVSGVATANSAPFADAGLDQQVERGTTVYLDAGGARDPDGTIAAYRWRIEAPNGTTFAPECLSCVRTSFVPSQTGRYDVTVTVTDDDGARRSDTLYVRVDRATPPSVDVSGPSTLATGSSGTFEASVAAGDAPLLALVWYVDGAVRERATLDGESATHTLDVSFSNAGEHTVSVLVTDREGRQGSDNTSVVARRVTSGWDFPGSVGGADFLQYDDFENPSTVTITDEDADGIEFWTDNRGMQKWITEDGLTKLMKKGGDKETKPDGSVIYTFKGVAVEEIIGSVDRYDGIGSTWRLDEQISGEDPDVNNGDGKETSDNEDSTDRTSVSIPKGDNQEDEKPVERNEETRRHTNPIRLV